eukprot:3638624-Pyramimonas_sp.AAC.1
MIAIAWYWWRRSSTWSGCQRAPTDGRLEAPSRRGARTPCSRHLRGACAAVTSQRCDWYSATR